MKTFLTSAAVILCSALLMSCVDSPGYRGKYTAPGQIQNATGYNPAAGKFKADKLFGNPGHGHGKAKGKGKGKGKS